MKGEGKKRCMYREDTKYNMYICTYSTLAYEIVRKECRKENIEFTCKSCTRMHRHKQPSAMAYIKHTDRRVRNFVYMYTCMYRLLRAA